MILMLLSTDENRLFKSSNGRIASVNGGVQLPNVEVLNTRVASVVFVSLIWTPKDIICKKNVKKIIRSIEY